MSCSLETIRESLRTMAQQYHAVVEGGRLKPGEWMENVKFLRPIAQALHQVAQSQLNQCQAELEEKNRAHAQCLEKRVKAYALMEQKKGDLSELDRMLIGLTTQITNIGEDIRGKQAEIGTCQEKIRRAEDERHYWDTVFWATCWIPFVNIGTGCKAADVEAGYRAQVKVLSGEIDRLRERAAGLNEELRRLRQLSTDKNEESAEIARQISAINGQVAQLTAQLNDLSRQIGLWRSIRESCRSIDTMLGHANGKLEEVTRCFEELIRVEELLKAPTTTRFVEDKVCRGSSLKMGESLGRGEYLISPNKRFIALLGADNALEVCNSEEALWSSGTQGARGEAVLRLDGSGPATLMGTDQGWHTKRPGAVSLVMQDDGNLVAYDRDGQSLWASDTFTYADVDSVCFQPQAI